MRLYSREELARGFRELGVNAGDTVLLHASVRAVGPVAGGPDVIHLALKDALTPAGTLIMYASCPAHFDEVGRGHLSAAEEAEIRAKLPAFDPLTARSERENGALVELLRTYPGSRVNNHVARFVAWGQHSEHIVSEHPWNYPYGVGTPLDRFLQLDGKILLLGCDHDNTTFLHYVEHVADFHGKRVARFLVPVERDGVKVWLETEEFDTSGDGAHSNWPDRFFAQLVDGCLETRRNRGGFVGDARSFLLPARGLFEYALPRMQAVAAGQP